MALRSDVRHCTGIHHASHDASAVRCLALAPGGRRLAAAVMAPRPQTATYWSNAPSCSPHCQRSRLSIVCMAHPRRVAKVASQIQKEISNMFIFDEEVVRAITPERSGGGTDLSALASITHVYVSNDLQVVKVYVSIYSDERGKQKAMNRLKRLEWYVRREMGQRVPLRLTPEYRFEYDDSIEEADLVARVIGDEDIARFTQELEQEEAGSVVQGSIPAGQQRKSKAGKGGDQGDDDEDGFFDADDMADRAENDRDVDDSRYVQYSTTDVFHRPGPFDDLFGSATAPQRQEAGRGGRGSRGRGGRGSGTPGGRGQRGGRMVSK